MKNARKLLRGWLASLSPGARVKLAVVGVIVVGSFALAAVEESHKPKAPSPTDTAGAREKVRLQIPENLSPEANKVIAESWPNVMAACPGFSKYGKDIKNTKIYDSLNATYFPAVEVYFEISDRPSTIPSDFRASGHTCSYDINPLGTNLRIQKDPCVMVCIDGPHNGNGEDYNLRI